MPLLKLPNAAPLTLLWLFQNDGLLNVLSLGSKNAEGFEKIVKKRSTPAFKWLFWYLPVCC